MKQHVYILLDQGSSEILAVSTSMVGVGSSAIGEGQELVFEDGSPFTLDNLQARLSREASAVLFTAVQKEPSLRVERHFVSP